MEKGVDIETVRDLLGHSSIIITQRYTHSNDDRKRKAVELLSCDVCATHGRINQRCARSSADRAVDFESEGREFESLRACQLSSHLNQIILCDTSQRVTAEGQNESSKEGQNESFSQNFSIEHVY